jgi:membrane-associated phospholipid phosphatase
VASISNQYAAMPSLHVGWAMWCGWAVWREVRSRWIRVVAVAYPALAMVAVVATGNHFILDIAGAAIVLAAGIGLADWNRRRITPSAVVGAEPHEPAAHASPASVRAPERTARRGSHIARTDDLPDHASFAGG